MGSMTAISLPAALRTVRRISPAGMLVVLVVAAYLRGTGYEFVYDEIGQIRENRFIQQPGSIRQVLMLRTLNDGSVINGRRPLVLLTYLADFRAWGLNPYGWRLTSLLLHAACTLALWGMLRQVIRSGRGSLAWLAAAIFGLHPLNSEAVHVAAFRPDILVTLFALLAVTLALRFRGDSRPAVLIASSWLFAALALASKESGIVVPLLTGLAWWLYPEYRPRWTAAVAVLAGEFVLAALFAAAALRPPQAGIPLPRFQALGGVPGPYSLPPPLNFLSAPWILAIYIRLLLLPWPLVLDRVVEPVRGIGDLRLWGGMTVAAAAVLVVLRARRQQPLIALGTGWLLISWLPVSNLVPLFNPLADRYAYMLAAGFAMALAGCMAVLTRRALLRKAALGGATFLIAAFFVLVQVRLEDYRDGETLWRTTLSQEPRSSRARVWLGLYCKHRGEPDRALELFREARRLRPGEVSAWINEAIIYGERGDLERAVRLLEQAVRLRPDSALAYANLAHAYELSGRLEEAARMMAAARRLDPRLSPPLLAAGEGPLRKSAPCPETGGARCLP